MAGYQSQLSHPLLSPYLLTGTALTEETTPFTLVHRPPCFLFPPGAYLLSLSPFLQEGPSEHVLVLTVFFFLNIESP